MNLVLGLVASAMAKATVPVLAAQNATDGRPDRVGRTLSVALSLTLLVLGLGSLVMGLATSSVVAVLAPGFEGPQAA